MARSGSAASLSLTIGIAFATLVAGTGIVAGPAVFDCSQHPSSFGSCLRGKVVQGGFLPPEPMPPVLVSSEDPALRAPGWIEANATEYEAPASGVAFLSAEPGRLDAVGALPGTEVNAEIALVDPGATIRADGLAPLPRPSADASLAPLTTGAIDASGKGVPADGLLGATSVEPPALPVRPEVRGQAGPAAHGQGRASLAPQLIADLSPVPPLDEIIAPVVPKAPPPRIAPRKPAVPKITAQAKPKAVTPRPPKYDPRYPNVLVLPPPNTGENSSFATLEVR